MLGKLLARTRPPAPGHQRAITEFAFIDGQPVFGSEIRFSASYRGAMSIPGAWRAATLIAGLLGMVPWHAYRSRAGRRMERVEPTPLLLEQPNPPDTRMTTLYSLALDYLWHGNAVAVVAARNAEGWPTAAVPVAADSVGVRRVGPGATSPLPVGTIEYNIGDISFRADDIIHIKGPCKPGSLRGMGILEVHMPTLELAKAQQQQAQSISHHGVPTGVLKSENPDLTPPEAEQLKNRWLTAQKSRTIAVLNASTSFQPLAWNPEELQLVEARKFSLTELELIFGLPIGWLGGQTSSRTYANIEQDAVNLLKFTLGAHLAQFEQTLSLHLPRGTEAKANLDALLRPDTLTRYQAHAIALANRFLTVEEVRDLENREPLPPETTQPVPPETAQP